MIKSKFKLITRSLALLMTLSVCTGCTGSKTGKLFTTEYDIEDYCENAIIVSKTDGKVYGLLDNKGKEILPVDYDDLDFVNKDEYVTSEHENLYLKAEREEFEMILDVKGNEILKSTGHLYDLSFELDNDADDNTPFFYESIMSSDKNTIEKYKFYNKNGDFLSGVDRHVKLGGTIWLSNKCYIEWSFADMVVYNYKGEEMHRFDKGLGYKVKSGDLFNMYLLSNAEEKDLEEVIIDADGNIKSKGNIITFNEYLSKYSAITAENKKENKSKKPYNLYGSNSTMKLEDWDGNTLYEERYFDSLSPSGENDCVGLTNEDNQLCIVGRNGVKYIDFGLLEYNEDEEKVYMVNKEEEKTEVKVIHEGKNSIIIPIESETGFDIYYYSEIKK
ncbi:MAG: hypothetical protein IJE10_05945 [Clostridia bacterium]|nr:hypothetical protein [Clostridia bacterium]